MADAIGSSIVVLGNFDGVHRGHRALLARAKARQAETGLPIVVWSFERLPGVSLMTPAQRRETLLACGADAVIYDDFERVKNMTPAAFVQDILFDRLQAAYCVCGYNYSYGCGGVGTAADLAAACQAAGRRCEVVDAVTEDGEPISSTRIRACLREGAVEKAAALLAGPFEFPCRVEGGHGFGRTMALPTLNQTPDPRRCLPKTGVYATYTVVDGQRYPSVTNIGCRPTVRDDGQTVVETHILSFSDTLYGREVTVGFLSFLREETKFPDTEALRRAILSDRERAAAIFEAYTERGE